MLTRISLAKYKNFKCTIKAKYKRDGELLSGRHTHTFIMSV